MDRASFVTLFGGVYEHSQWIAESCFEAGLVSDGQTAENLSAIMKQQVESADEVKRLALLRAHPDLAGKLAIQGELTTESSSEQASAGLDHCTAYEFERFQALNTAYQAKFQFPFILAVKGYQREQILDVLNAGFTMIMVMNFAKP